MTGVDDPGPDDGLDPAGAPAARAWQHPSEVGLARRGRTDRRRTTFIASGVLLGGLGLLLSGMLMGASDTPIAASTTTRPGDRAEASVATVSLEGDDGAPRVATGVVLDDEGHLVVDTSGLDGALTDATDTSEIWAKCGDATMQQVELVGVDAATALAVLRMPRPAGVPASFATTTPAAGTALHVHRAGRVFDGTSVSDATERTTTMGALISLGPDRTQLAFGAQVDADVPADDALLGAAVFDPSGRLGGLVRSADGGDGTLEVLAAQDVAEAADRVLHDRS